MVLTDCISAGDQRHGDPGADAQRAGPDDGDPADLPPVEGQQQPLRQAEPPHLLAAVRPPGRIPAEPGGTHTTNHAVPRSHDPSSYRKFTFCFKNCLLFCDGKQTPLVDTLTCNVAFRDFFFYKNKQKVFVEQLAL